MIERQFGWASVAAIVFAGLVVYVDQLGFYFTDVDTFSLIATSRFHSLDEFVSIFTSPMMKGQLPNALFFRPFASFTWGVDELIWGMNPLGYHLSDLLIHIANCLLLFQLMRGTARWQEKSSAARDSITAGDIDALLAAALFAVHPLAAETVPAIARRPDLLFGFFGLLALNFALRFLRMQSNRERIAIAICCVFALASKDSAVIVLPLVGAFAFCFCEAASLRERAWMCVRIGAIPLVAVVLYVAARTLVLGSLGGYESAFGVDLASVAKTSASVFLCAFAMPGQLDSCLPSAAPANALLLASFFALSAARLLGDRTGAEARRFVFASLSLALFMALYLATRTVALTRTIYALIPFLCILIAWSTRDALALVRSILHARSESNTSLAVRLLLAAISAYLVGNILHAASRGQYLDEWRAIGDTTRDIVDSIDDSIESLAPGSTVYTVNLPFKVSDPAPVLRDHPIVTDYSLQGWADLAHPRRQLTVVGLTRLRIALDDPADLSSSVSFDLASSRLVCEVGSKATVEAFDRKRRWGREHPLQVVSHEEGPHGSRLEIELLPEAFERLPVAFWVYSGDRVELLRHETFRVSHRKAGSQ